MIRKYKHIFFDLDHTLWDFKKNSSSTLLEIIDVFKLNSRVTNLDKWIVDFSEYNNNVWDKYERGMLKKSELRLERFRLLLASVGIVDEELVYNISSFYLENSPKKSALMPGAKECLNYLYGNYNLHIISNGFFEIQQIKLQSSGISQFFKSLTTSDRILAAKPDRRIFQEALKPNNASKAHSLLVGDNFEKDIVGAARFGIDQVWYNPLGIDTNTDVKATYEISNLLELKSLL